MKLFEIMDMKDAAKQIDGDVARKAVVKGGGNPFDNKISKAVRKVKNAFKKK